MDSREDFLFETCVVWYTTNSINEFQYVRCEHSVFVVKLKAIQNRFEYSITKYTFTYLQIDSS